MYAHLVTLRLLRFPLSPSIHPVSSVSSAGFAIPLDLIWGFAIPTALQMPISFPAALQMQLNEREE